MGNKTFAIIKPDAVKAGNTGKIYDRIIQAEFHIMSAKLLKLTEEQARVAGNTVFDPHGEGEKQFMGIHIRRPKEK